MITQNIFANSVRGSGFNDWNIARNSFVDSILSGRNPARTRNKPSLGMRGYYSNYAPVQPRPNLHEPPTRSSTRHSSEPLPEFGASVSADWTIGLDLKTLKLTGG